ncbi:aminotransferase class I/II-fold pyridoxal phosphate-dependent enzyme [Vicingaceae bacterium]|nr:aminotransferase class I/II-fold pyridoxal phosphate-dependent enzyme [Vicingaceae bacterium]
MIVDLRSDTVTQPTSEMKEAMLNTIVGDDVLGDDPTVIQLEELVAGRFGHEAALFCPSGTMTNQIAINVHTSAPGEVICDDLAHIYRYEGGGMAFNSAVSNRLIKGDRGRFTLEQLKAEINQDDIHFPPSQLVALENTCNKGGGCYWEMNEIEKIATYCRSKNIPIHLDGARLYNALVAQNTLELEIGMHFDSISICLSKGLGAPVGSLLTGTKSFIKKARRIRKIFGGGMRQSGYLAAAGIYALENNVERLKVDHENAKTIGNILDSKKEIKEIYPIDTNIVIYVLNDNIDLQDYLNRLNNKGIRAVSMGAQTVRLVTHLGIGKPEMGYLQTNL